MPHSFWIFLLTSLLLVYLGKKIFAKKPEPVLEKPKSVEIHFFGGPLDDHVFSITEAEDYYVTPYIPRDEDGNYDMSQVKERGRMGDKVFIEPNMAFYTQVTPDSYFYVRDVTQPELNKLNANPTWRPSPKDETEE